MTHTGGRTTIDSRGHERGEGNPNMVLAERSAGGCDRARDNVAAAPREAHRDGQMAGGLRMQPPLFRAGWRAFRGHLGLNDQHHQRIATSRRPISPQSLPDTAIGVSKLIHQQTCHGQKAGNSLEHCLWFTQTAAY
ncbi:predicted protein [Histoplasma capsulatum G186AR]|uniref:Uncharacterized protein n=1 Tax=Ajellomyces capsulatus (strain G186AR / H82 / ATCC MYA-2454 / RMSCC 2432) TaxID=447093 RepID=C0NVK1_AJECG|nr:uncharacterized protein HCBG_07181 [Histoplasma capsulatum G186AR]EEH04540.1 predicted protein [Histoplasma capsulatum G186AR]